MLADQRQQREPGGGQCVDLGDSMVVNGGVAADTCSESLNTTLARCLLANAKRNQAGKPACIDHANARP